jgi:hypothetical protein
MAKRKRGFTADYGTASSGPGNLQNLAKPGPTPIEKVIFELTCLFVKKNAQYATDANIFANFDESAPVSQHLMSPLLYCMTLAAKQDDAFWKALNRSEGEKSNIRERLMDGAVYRIIALALMDRG